MRTTEKVRIKGDVYFKPVFGHYKMFFAEVIVRKSAIASLVYFLAMILPKRKVDPPGIYEKPFKEMYDYIVVGSGSAGSVVATRLSEDCYTSVLLLEAGISDLDPDDVTQIPSLWPSLIGSEKDWGYRSVPQKYSHLAYENERAYIAQGKVLGGSSSINAQAFVRGSRNNYDQWEHEGAVGWGYDDVLPFFRKLENATDTSYGDSTLRGLHGPIVIKEITGSILQSFHQTAAMEIGFSTVDCNSDDPIGFCKNQMNVKDGKRCSTSTCYLRPALDRRNLQVSLRSRVTKVLIRNNKAVGVEFLKDGKRQRIFAKHEVILSAGFISSAQILMLSGIGPRKHLQQMKIVKEHLKRVAENSFIARMFLLQPRSKGNLRLSDNSPFSSPIIDPRYLSHPEDIEDFVRGIRLMRSLEQTKAWKSIGATLVRQDVPGHCSEQIFDSDNYWRCIGRHFLTTASHFVGTCRMGSVNDPSVVVDSRLRVIGIKNLRVADASVMRYLPSGHTNAPAMMIGEKAADMIRRDRTHRYNI
ncbi:Uncharacterized GMC-type oxidoreductase Mb1310,Glucose dehydrogenase [FAD, quinone],Oxygen-dependent choline dehydrogenase [Mytilus edulis]|uniref:Uncharacterized GMC-type oxidoreductase Mb1310,Glucose dehydrogenase [FAD, quinone],Oxygen-dependent choline dehydrogenase n=1 Tax=Mytilus edulis TaxID=6550 RepID=A0A8S3TPW6_MYTED|nr:Uncharacterized GMC-type oxidoreductase Mb1310,Glucose dehydrogenase [FAD, quinone],Oxygen-dependent choline dehydrogenase [Mytilus edulis]